MLDSQIFIQINKSYVQLKIVFWQTKISTAHFKDFKKRLRHIKTIEFHHHSLEIILLK